MQRIETAAALLSEAHVADVAHDSDGAFALLEEALTTTTFPHGAAAWLSLVAVYGEYPDEPSVDRVARTVRMDGTGRAVDDLRRVASERAADGLGTSARLRVVTDRVLVDVTHTAKAEMHTGIQRVVRETVGRWLESGRPVELASFSSSANALRPLRGAAAARFVDWRAHVGSEAKPRGNEPTERDDDVLVPWQSVLIVPEVIFDHARLEAYRALGGAGVLESLSLIGFDLVPVTAAETTKEGLSDTFARYLAVVKHADRISAISRSSARDFAAFGEMVEAQGLEAPVVRPHGLPVDRPRVSDESLDAWRALFGERGAPTVLVVGSHEPRKNHLAVLEAAERLWSTGASFQLLMIGGQSWKAEEFEALAGALRARGRPIEIVGRLLRGEALGCVRARPVLRVPLAARRLRASDRGVARFGHSCCHLGLRQHGRGCRRRGMPSRGPARPGRARSCDATAPGRRGAPRAPSGRGARTAFAYVGRLRGGGLGVPDTWLSARARLIDARRQRSSGSRSIVPVLCSGLSRNDAIDGKRDFVLCGR